MIISHGHGAAMPDAETGERSADPRWTAVMERDREWDGAFVFAVTSTRIYCRPSCPSRRPRVDRVRFYTSGAEARAAGFRACRRCHPDRTDAPTTRMVLTSRVIGMLAERDGATLDELATATGVSRAHLQRTFTEVMGVSPAEFATHLRAERMRASLTRGATVSAAAFDAGFGSLPSAYAAADKELGMSPGAYRRKGAGVEIGYRVAECALGLALVAVSARGVCRVIVGDDADAMIGELQREFSEATIRDVGEVTLEDATLAAAIDAVVAIAAGRATDVDVPLDVRGTAFQQRVWRALRAIPRGDTASYAELAARVDAPTAVRAVGSACGANPVALLVPCHRVVRSDGGLGGYRWGIERKRSLLEKERDI